MSTQRRVVRLQRFLVTELSGVAESSSRDEAIAVPQQQFRRVSDGLTASSCWSLYGRTRDVTNSLSFREKSELLYPADEMSDCIFSQGKCYLARLERVHLLGFCFSSCCKWRFRHGSKETSDAVVSKSRTATESGFGPAHPTGSFPPQLPLISPLLSSAFQRERLRLGSCEPGVAALVRSVQSALPQGPMGVDPGTERQHGQGNLYLQHATRNTDCNSGRRSARRDLLRA